LSLSRGLFLTASLHLASVAERDPGALARGPGVVRQAGQDLAEQVGRHEAGAGGVPGAGGVLEDRGQREGGRVMKVYLLLYHPDHEQRYPVPVGVYLSRAGAAAARPGAWLVFDEYYRIPDHPCPALGCFVLTRHGVPPTYDGDDTRLANLVSGDHEVE